MVATVTMGKPLPLPATTTWNYARGDIAGNCSTHAYTRIHVHAHTHAHLARSVCQTETNRRRRRRRKRRRLPTLWQGAFTRCNAAATHTQADTLSLTHSLTLTHTHTRLSFAGLLGIFVHGAARRGASRRLRQKFLRPKWANALEF